MTCRILKNSNKSHIFWEVTHSPAHPKM